MEIIQLPYNGDNSVKNVYTKYSFGKNKNSSTTEVDKLLIKSEPIMDTPINIVSKKEEPKKTEPVKEEKKQTKTVVVEESEYEEESDSEKDSDSDSDDVDVKPVSKGKQVVSKTPLKKK